jgi:hypothetical protein
MSRKDGRPRSVVMIGLDPLPWREGRNRSATARASYEFDPRDGYEQDPEAYGVT